MNPNPFSGLIHSRKFLLLLLDTIIALVSYFVTKYVPSAASDVKFLVLTIQPVFIAVIIAIAAEDVSLNKANGGGGQG